MKRITSLLVCLVMLGFNALAQDIQITGKVTSAEDGSILPGVSVVVKGTTTGTTTSVDGEYSLSAPSDAVLVFSFVGMETQEVAVSNRTTIDISMSMSTMEVDEVVVTAFGISREKKALGYSVANISGEDAQSESESDLLRSLQGKVPGVDISAANGVPGGASRITIRGVNSFTGDNQPLFVVDGIPYSNTQYNTTSQNTGGGAYGTGISTLDPNDVESISVLKGAAASSLYGSRAKNGVIVITTKSGNAKNARKGLEVTFSSTFTFENISSLPEYQNTYGNGVDFSYANANGSWGPRFDSMDSIPTWPQYLAAFPDDFGDSVAYVAQPDNVKNLFEQGYLWENSLNIQGGNETSTFNLTLSSVNNDGYIPFSSYDRYNINVGGSTVLANKLRASANIAYTKSTQVGGIFGNNQADDDNAASGFARALWLGRTWNTDLPYTDPSTGGPINWNGNSQYDTPMWSWEHNKVTTNMDRMLANSRFSYDITNWLSASYQIGINVLQMQRTQVVDKYSRGYGGDGAIIDDRVREEEIESNFLLTFSKQFGDFDLTAILGHNLNQRKVDRMAYQGREIVNFGIYDLNNTNSVIPFGGYNQKRRSVGILGDVKLTYRGYLTLSASARNEWSSTLPIGSNSYFFPSVNASFIFTDAFEIDNTILSFGKVRLGWGTAAQSPDVYQTNPIYENKALDPPVYKLNAFPFLGQSAMTDPNDGTNPELKPEYLSEFEVGTDLYFFNNRIGLDLTYYNSTATDILYPVTLPATSGYTSRIDNIGEINNQGIEIGLDLTPVKLSNGFEWNIYGTFTKNKNEVVDIFPDQEGTEDDPERTILVGLFGDPQLIAQVGYPVNSFLGEVNVRDEEGNLLIDPNTGVLIRASEQQIYGDPHPDFRVGLTNTFKFKGVVLSALIDYRKGGDVYSGSVTSLLGRGVTKDTEDREHNFIIPGYYGDPNTEEPLLDGNGNKIPNTHQISMNDLYFGETFAINAAGEWNVFDGTVWRLREISLGYEFPKSLLDKTPFGSLYLSATGRNLWFFAPNIPKYCNFDPEVNGYGATNTQGVEYTVAPSVRRFGFNLRVSF